MDKTKSEAVSAWQPSAVAAGPGMHYTAGVSAAPAPNGTTLDGSSQLAGFMAAVPGNTYDKVTHGNVPLNLNSSSGLTN